MNMNKMRTPTKKHRKSGKRRAVTRVRGSKIQDRTVSVLLPVQSVVRNNLYVVAFTLSIKFKGNEYIEFQNATDIEKGSNEK